MECFIEASKQFPDCEPEDMFTLTMFFHTYDVLWKRKCEHYARYGITQGRFMMLILLMDDKNVCEKNRKFPARTPAGLADLAQISRASVTGLLDSLEKDGFVRRKPDPDDRRMVSIHLTARGKAFMDEFLPPHFKMMNKLMSGLDKNEQETLVVLLNKLIAKVNADVGDEKQANLKVNLKTYD